MKSWLICNETSDRLKKRKKQPSMKLQDVKGDSTWLNDSLRPWEVKTKDGQPPFRSSTDNLKSSWETC